jgi:hypothetical protein
LDDAEIFIEAWPDGAALPLRIELYVVKEADSVRAEEGKPGFLVLEPDAEFKLPAAP